MEHFTNHVLVRMKQRGISSDVVDVIMTHGIEVHCPGGAYKQIIPSKKVKELLKAINDYKKIILRAQNCELVEKDGKLLTAYHKK